MALYKLVSTRWDEPSPDSEVGFVRRRRGDVFEVSADDVDRLLRAGAIILADAPEAAPVDEAETVVPKADEESVTETGPDSETDDTPEAPVVPVSRPKQAAPKPAWVAYAVSRGMDRDEAEGLDKRELIAALD